MKGFNIGLHSAGSGSLPPVDESIQQLPENDDLFGSTQSSLCGTGATPKRSLHNISTSSIPGLGMSRHRSRVRVNSKKKRLNYFTKAAKVKVSKLMGKLNI